MGTPLKCNDPEEAILHAMNECISAMSALNMYPKPIPGDEYRWLSESDEWARHCTEHLREVMEALRLAERHQENRKNLIYRLAKRLSRRYAK